MDSAEAVAVEEASAADAEAVASEVAVEVEENLVEEEAAVAVEVSYQIYESNGKFHRLPARPTRKS